MNVHNRIMHGFSRLGIAAAVVLLPGGRLTAAIAVEEYSQAQQNVFLVAQTDPPCRAGYGKDCAPWERDSPAPPPSAFVTAKTADIGIGVTALLALAAFGFFRGLGWVLDGFARD
jgi:hypothetical protein